MSETLGMLCDKLTVIKLKQWHTVDKDRLSSLSMQEKQLQDEINQFIRNAIDGIIPLERLIFASNKVFKMENNLLADITGNIGEVFSKLADVNCTLWHEQEKVYEFEKVPMEEKDKVVKQLAVLNLERNKCIDEIDKQFYHMIQDMRM